MNTTEPEVWLAPMSGASDAPFRCQVVRFGCPNVVSEMTACDTFLERRPDVVRRTCRHQGKGPWVVQLAGRRPEDMRAAAHDLAAAGVDVIDINMGCPSRKVTGGLSGSALMRDLDLAARIIDATLEGADGVPVSLKMRLGWDERSLNAPKLAEYAEQAGIIRLTVHGRTRCQFYKGTADWQRIADTVNAVSIPVIANGDITNARDAARALHLSGATGVMIGRAAMGRPWLLAEISAALTGKSFTSPSIKTRAACLIDQVCDSVEFYGVSLGVRIVRKHIAAALDAGVFGESAEENRRRRATLCQIDDPAELITALEHLCAVPLAGAA